MQVRPKFKKRPLVPFLFLLLAVATFVGISSPLPARASFESALQWFFGYVVGMLASAIATFFAFILNVEFFFIDLILEVSKNILNNNLTVENGFQASLSIANLGFAAILIVIAVATILRVQEYGIKKAFAKLIIAALLVNFSLVIVGPIIGTADSFTSYIIDKGFNGPDGLSIRIMGALNPQRFFTPENEPGSGHLDKQAANELKSVFAETAQSEGVFYVIVVLGFMTVALALTSVVVGAIGIMLLIRYVVLSILLIIMPLIWVLWVFPTTRKYWSEWWSVFIKWTIFAPIMLFFLWVAAMAGVATEPYVDAATKGDSYKGIVQFITETFAHILKAGLQSAVVVGLIWGGLVVAQRLSIAGAGTAMAWAKKGGRFMGMGAARGARGIGRGMGRIATAPLRTERGQKITEQLQNKEAAEGWIKTLHSVPVVGRLTKRAGRGLETIARSHGEKLVDAEKARLEKKMSVDQMIKSVHAAKSTPEQIAMLELINKAGRLNEVQGAEKLLSKENAGKFKRFHRAKTFEELRGKSGVALVEAKQELEAAEKRGAPAEEIQKLKEKKEKALKAASPEALSKIFSVSEEDIKKGKTPYGLDAAGLHSLRAEIILGIAKGFSPHNLSEFFKELAKNNALGAYQKTAQDIGLKPEHFSPQNRRWFNSNAALNILGIRGEKELEIFLKGGTPSAEKKSPEPTKEKVVLYDASGRPVDKENLEEAPRNVRSRTTFDEKGNVTSEEHPSS